MNVKILTQTKNDVLKRSEITFEGHDFKVTPSRNELKAKISALLNKDEKLVVVGEINQKFGNQMVKGSARIYEDDAHLKKVELPKPLKKNLGIDVKAEKKKKQEAKPAATPAEEKK